VNKQEVISDFSLKRMAEGRFVRTSRGSNVQVDIRDVLVLPTSLGASLIGKKSVRTSSLRNSHTPWSNDGAIRAALAGWTLPGRPSSALPLAGCGVLPLKMQSREYTSRQKTGNSALNVIPGYPDAPKGPRYYLGLDFGTSGARAVVIDGKPIPLHPCGETYPSFCCLDPHTVEDFNLCEIGRLPSCFSVVDVHCPVVLIPSKRSCGKLLIGISVNTVILACERYCIIPRHHT
jgi:hypothetical protein